MYRRYPVQCTHASVVGLPRFKCVHADSIPRTGQFCKTCFGHGFGPAPRVWMTWVRVRAGPLLGLGDPTKSERSLWPFKSLQCLSMN